MKRAVDPVLGEVGDQHERRHLDEQRQRSHRRAHPSHARPVEENQRRPQREDRQDLDQQRVDEEVRQIDQPLAAEDGLIGPQREEPLERNEDGRVEQKIEDEEVEPEPGAAPHLAIDRDLRPAKEGRRQGEPDAGQGEHLVRAEKGTDAGEEERRHENHVDDRPQ